MSSDSDLTAVSGPKRWRVWVPYYTPDMWGLHAGPYSIMVFWNPILWYWAWGFGDAGAMICAGPLTLTYTTGRMPF